MALPMSLIDVAPDSAIASAISASSSAVGQLRRQVGLQQLDFLVLLRDQVVAAAALELRDGFLAHLDHLLDDREHLRVVERDALVDFALLDGSGDHADRAEALAVLGAHRGLHVFGDAVLERHE